MSHSTPPSSPLFSLLSDAQSSGIAGGFDVTGPQGLVTSAGDPTKAVYGIDKQATSGDPKAAFFDPTKTNDNWATGPAVSNNDDARGRVV
jgi:hypothetical protein